MARPKKVGLEYFPLDCKMDDKVEILEAEYGLEGFAVYVKLLQEIYQTEDGMLDMSVVFRWKTLGKRYGIDGKRLENIVDLCLEVGLFCKICYADGQKLTSNGVKKRIGKVSDMRNKDRSRKSDNPEEFSDGKPKENTRKSAQKEKEKESSLPTTAAPEESEPENTNSAELSALPNPLPREAIVVDYAVATVEIETHRSQVLNARQAKERECMKLKIDLPYYDALTNAFFDKLLSDAERKVGIEFYRIKAHFDNWIRVQVNLGLESDYHPQHVNLKPVFAPSPLAARFAKQSFTPTAHVYNELN